MSESDTSRNRQVPKLILGYVLADSGGTAILVREFVPIFTKEGRDFFAQISSIIYSFVEGLVHSELKHVETENMHLYFARQGEFILVLFSDIEDEKLINLAGNIIKVVSDLGYDTFTVQLDDEAREEVIGIIEKNIVTIPPNIRFAKKIITMVSPLMDTKKNVKIYASPYEIKQMGIEDYLKRRKHIKMLSVDQESLAKLVLECKFDEALMVSYQLIEGDLGDAARAIIAKSVEFAHLTNLEKETIPLDEIVEIVSQISHPILRDFIKVEMESFRNIKAGIDRRLYFLKHRRMFLTKILTETKDALLYATLSFPPTDVETAKILKEQFEKQYPFFAAYCDDHVYCYKTLLMKEVSQETWLLTLGEIYDKMMKFLDTNKSTALIYLRSYMVNVLASIIQSELKESEVKNILETFLNNWKGWEKALKTTKDLWLDIRCLIYAFYLEIVKWYLLLKPDGLGKAFLRDLERKAIEYLRTTLTVINSKRSPLIHVFKAAASILSSLAEIMTLNGKYSEELFTLINDLLRDDLVTLWSENPAEFALIYRHFLSALANLSKFVKIDSIRTKVLLDIGKELFALAKTFEKLPMIYWPIIIDAARTLANAGEEGIKEVEEIIKYTEEYAPPAIRKLLKEIIAR